MDFDATNDPDGWAAVACGSAADFAGGPCSDVAAVAVAGLSLSCLVAAADLSVTAGAVVATGAAIGTGEGDGFAREAEGSIDAVIVGVAGRGEAAEAAVAEGEPFADDAAAGIDWVALPRFKSA